MERVEIIRDGSDWYVVGKNGVKPFFREYASSSGLPYEVEKAVEALLGVNENDE